MNIKQSEMVKDKRWVVDVSMQPPCLEDNTADADRLGKALAVKLGSEKVLMDLPLLKKIPEKLRRWHYSCKCVVFESTGTWRLIDIIDPGYKEALAGLAVDLGTTRVVLRLVDLQTGQNLGETAFDNPQAEIGPDVLTRIHYADQAGGLEKLNRLIIGAINENVSAICKKAKIESDQVYLVALSGNTAMSHLFMGLPAGWIIREPYIPAVNAPAVICSQNLGLEINQSSLVFVFPNAGSYFGGDVVSGAYYAGFHENEQVAMLVDVGTNAEVVLGNRDWLVVCAGAAGPALEGGVSEIGMTAGPGVIDSVFIDPDTRQFEISTIDDVPPRGICGSGMIDLAAQLFLAGMIDIRGRLVPDACGSRLKQEDEMRHLVVVFADQSATGADLTISQADIDSLIRSKAAMYTILETITGYVGISFNEIDVFYVAGTFGSFIRPRSAISIGMIPDMPESFYQPLGNSSLEGAASLLKSRDSVSCIESLRDRMTYLELNVNQDFMNRFSAAKFLPHTDAARFPSVSRYP